MYRIRAALAAQIGNSFVRARTRRVARPCAKHRPGREATRSRAIRVQALSDLPVRCHGLPGIKQYTFAHGAASCRECDPAALCGTAGPPQRLCRVRENAPGPRHRVGTLTGTATNRAVTAQKNGTALIPGRQSGRRKKSARSPQWSVLPSGSRGNQAVPEREDAAAIRNPATSSALVRLSTGMPVLKSNWQAIRP